MSSYEDRMSEKYGFFSDNKKLDSDEQNQTHEDDHSEELQASDENNLIVPLEAWQTVLNQLGNLHEANQLMAEARERAAKAEAEAEFEIAELFDDMGSAAALDEDGNELIKDEPKAKVEPEEKVEE